jgi:M-phase inducer tyrosine phosphatase
LLRSQDRRQVVEHHMADADRVYYPNVYILDGGYSRFFERYPGFCDPVGYIRMDDRAFKAEYVRETSILRKGNKSKRCFSEGFLR